MILNSNIKLVFKIICVQYIIFYNYVHLNSYSYCHRPSFSHDFYRKSSQYKSCAVFKSFKCLCVTLWFWNSKNLVGMTIHPMYFLNVCYFISQTSQKKNFSAKMFFEGHHIWLMHDVFWLHIKYKTNSKLQCYIFVQLNCINLIKEIKTEKLNMKSYCKGFWK